MTPPTEQTHRPAGRLIRRLIVLGVTPNRISYAGLLCALGAAAALAAGAGHQAPWAAGACNASDARLAQAPPVSWWPFAAAVLLAGSAILDLLDGAVARAAGLQTRFGAILDSTLDRFGDLALYAGCAVYWSGHSNVTFVLLSFLAAAGAVQVSYVKARGECFVEGLGVGFWQRGERIVALLVGAVSGSVATALSMLAIFPLFTVLRRVRLSRRLVGDAPGTGEPPPTTRAVSSLLAAAPWNEGRRTLAYWAFCAVLAATIIAGPRLHPFLGGVEDPLGVWMHRVGR
ncbi:MAG: CDP-alcohol phosphatidyltransferase family protein [Candidatus Binatia bacterium]